MRLSELLAITDKEMIIEVMSSFDLDVIHKGTVDSEELKPYYKHEVYFISSSSVTNQHLYIYIYLGE